METKPLTFAQGIKDCIPTLFGYFSIGLACGIVGIATHLSILEIVLMATFIYAGAAQFIICALVAVHTPITAIILTTFIVNLRNFLLSMTLAPTFKHYSLIQNLSFGALLTDETFGVAINKKMQKYQLNAAWMHGVNIIAYVFWIISCFVGALFGKWIKNPEAFGLDYSLTAMFVALLVLTLEHIPKNKLVLYMELIAIVILSMFILCIFIPSYTAILLSTMIAATIGVIKDR